LIGLTGLVTGIAAALSMAASEYLSTETEDVGRRPIKAAVYTGSAYLLSVVLLILPYLLIGDYFVCLACSLLIAVLIITAFSYYVSVAQDVSFRRPFLQMTGLALGVAALSFLIGLAVRTVLGVDSWRRPKPIGRLP
jgi:VIT1/CCC1 family predicted Fe2+/Mn2+ transporter